MSKKGNNIYEETPGQKRDLGGGASVRTKPGHKLKNSSQPAFDFMPDTIGCFPDEALKKSRAAVDEIGSNGKPKSPTKTETVGGKTVVIGPDGFVR